MAYEASAEGDGENDSTVSPSHTEERVRVENRLVLNGNLSQDLNFTFPFGEFSNAHLDLLDITLGFPRSESANEFETAAYANGFEVLESIPSLGVLRVRITDFAKAMDTLDELGVAWSWLGTLGCGCLNYLKLIESLEKKDSAIKLSIGLAHPRIASIGEKG